MIMAGFLSAITVPYLDRPILLDSRCETSEYVGAASYPLAEGVTLQMLHDDHFWTLCIALPDDSFASLDLYLRPPGNEEVLNLHVSAQVGERLLRPGEEARWQFGNHQGWFGPPNAFRGIGRDSDGAAYGQFRLIAGRELQLAKTRFGDGPWEIRLELHDVAPAPYRSVFWPVEDSDQWQEIRLAPKSEHQ